LLRGFLREIDKKISDFFKFQNFEFFSTIDITNIFNGL